jgi:hypothetical protein
VVVFPQAPELSTARHQIGTSPQQGSPQENQQTSIGRSNAFHTSTAPYYN